MSGARLAVTIDSIQTNMTGLPLWVCRVLCDPRRALRQLSVHPLHQWRHQRRPGHVAVHRIQVGAGFDSSLVIWNLLVVQRLTQLSEISAVCPRVAASCLQFVLKLHA